MNYLIIFNTFHSFHWALMQTTTLFILFSTVILLLEEKIITSIYITPLNFLKGIPGAGRGEGIHVHYESTKQKQLLAT